MGDLEWLPWRSDLGAEGWRMEQELAEARGIYQRKPDVLEELRYA